jgi:hypothetical protein
LAVPIHELIDGFDVFNYALLGCLVSPHTAIILTLIFLLSLADDIWFQWLIEFQLGDISGYFQQCVLYPAGKDVSRLRLTTPLVSFFG